MPDPTLVQSAGYLGTALAMGLGAVGSGVGEGYAAGRAVEAIHRQPNEEGNLIKHMLIGQAVAETPGVFSLLIAVFLLSKLGGAPNVLSQAAAFVGAGLTIGLASIGAGTMSGYVAGEAVRGLGTQPESNARMTLTMLIGQAMCQSPLIFALVVSLLLTLFTGRALPGPQMLIQSCALLGTAIAMGLGAIGPATGIGFAGGRACESYGRHTGQNAVVMRTFLVGAAVTESTGIYAFVVCLLLYYAAMTVMT